MNVICDGSFVGSDEISRTIGRLIEVKIGRYCCVTAGRQATEAVLSVISIIVLSRGFPIRNTSQNVPVRRTLLPRALSCNLIQSNM